VLTQSRSLKKESFWGIKEINDSPVVHRWKNSISALLWHQLLNPSLGVCSTQ